MGLLSHMSKTLYVQKESVTKVFTSMLSCKKSVLLHSIRFVNRRCKVQFKVGNSEVNITKLNANMIKPIVGITIHITSKPDVELGKSKMQRVLHGAHIWYLDVQVAQSLTWSW
jgi:hypothetical protein